MLCAVYARPAENDRRLGARGTRLSSNTLYTREVRRELVDVFGDAETRENSMFRAGDSVVGIAVLQPWFSPDIVSYLTPHPRATNDCWQATRYAGNPIAFLRCVKAALLDEALLVVESFSRPHKTSLFSKTKTHASWQCVMECAVNEGT